MKISYVLLSCLALFSQNSKAYASSCSYKPPRISITADFPPPVLDRSLSSSQLTQAIGSTATDMTTRGLTVTNAFVKRNAELILEKPPGSPDWCVNVKTLNISVTMREPVRVYIASDILTGSCEDRTTISHEQEHVNFAFNAQTRMAKDIGNRLPDMLAIDLPVLAFSEVEATQAIDGILSRDINQIIKPAQDEQAFMNSNIDTPENYAKVAKMCP
jgi:hypothetical protein